MMAKQPFEKLTDEETAFIKTWYKEQNDDEGILRVINKNPFYFSKSIDFCRSKRKQIYSLIMLSLGSRDAKAFYKKWFPLTIKTIDDLVIFLDLIKEKRGFGRLIHASVESWFNSKAPTILEDELIKNFKNPNTSWRNKDVLNKFHVKPKNRVISNLLKKAVEEDNKREKITL